MKVWKKPLVVTAATAVVASSVLLANPSFAATAQQKLNAVYSNIVIKYNNATVSTDSTTEPFMVNGTTFVPVRLIGEATGNKVTWDQTTKTINISSTTSSTDQATIDSLTKELAEAKLDLSDKNAEITQLSAKLAAALEEDEDVDIDDLEDSIKDDYEDYNDTDASIKVTGDEDDVEVTIEVDEDGWNDLSSTKQKNYLQNIVDDILDVYEDADITGTVENDDSDELVTFTVSSSGTVKVTEASADIDDVEDDLNDDYGDYKGYTWDIRLSGDEDDLTVKVYVADDEWESMSSSTISNFQDYIIDALEDEFPDADITGYIYSDDDGSRLDTF